MREGFDRDGHTNVPMANADQELVKRLLRGDARAFDEFFNEYYPKLYRFVKRRMPNDPAGAEDVAQGTICRALESLSGFRGEAALMTWLCTLCRRELGARWRSSPPQAMPALAEDDPEVRAALESLLAAESLDPLLQAGREQVRETICAALDYLPAPYADILEWKYVRDMSVAEIAGRLGRSAKATESLLTRARESFRETFTLLRGGAPGAAP
jgi:RNA polymerase sigma-70 factor, ECF subfamily